MLPDTRNLGLQIPSGETSEDGFSTRCRSKTRKGEGFGENYNSFRKSCRELPVTQFPRGQLQLAWNKILHSFSLQNGVIIVITGIVPHLHLLTFILYNYSVQSEMQSTSTYSDLWCGELINYHDSTKVRFSTHNLSSVNHHLRHEHSVSLSSKRETPLIAHGLRCADKNRSSVI